MKGRLFIEKITVIDAPCGGGKTSWAIQLMRADTETSYIYCTPFLDEIDRIRKACGKYRFYEPKNFGTSKIEDFNKLLSQGRDIAVTHSTFLNATPKTVELIEQGEYTLILDEAPDIIGDFNKVASVENAAEQAINTHDVKAMLRDGLISIGDNSQVIWTGNDYAGTKYSEVERLAKLGRLYYANDSILCMFPPEVFLAFKKVYVMTYLLEGTFIKYYFDLFGISYEKATTMNRKLNRDKSNLMLNFGSANIKVNTTINDRQEVLVEYIMPQGKTIYYKCKAPEDFVNWQNLFLGKSDLTKHKKIVDLIKKQWIFLRDVFRKNSKSDLTIGEKTEIFQKWIHNSKRLLYMDAINNKSFPIYTANWKFKNMIVPDEVGQILEYGITGWEFVGQPIEEVHIRIEKLEQGDENKG